MVRLGQTDAASVLAANPQRSKRNLSVTSTRDSLRSLATALKSSGAVGSRNHPVAALVRGLAVSDASWLALRHRSRRTRPSNFANLALPREAARFR